jgi:hypothetical protein
MTKISFYSADLRLWDKYDLLVNLHLLYYIYTLNSRSRIGTPLGCPVHRFRLEGIFAPSTIDPLGMGLRSSCVNFCASIDESRRLPYAGLPTEPATAAEQRGSHAKRFRCKQFICG